MLFTTNGPKTPQWRYLSLWLVIAFVIRAYIALAGNFILHPDEVIQYLEPAHRLVFGYGIVSWEFYYGARSWLIPGFVAGILWALDQLGLGEPGVYVYVVKLVFCLLALLIPWGIYHYARHIVAEHAARAALVLACLWPYLAIFAHKPMTEFVATNLLCAALGLASLPLSQGKRGAFVFGAVIALVAAVRMQYLPIAGLLWLARALPMNRSWIAISVAGGLMILAVVGLLETYTWGAPFHSYYYNYLFNIKIDIDRNLVPWNYYLSRLVYATAGLLLIAAWACCRQLHRYLLLLSMILIVLLLHTYQYHKEFRFIFIILALWIIPFCGQLYDWSKSISPRIILRWLVGITATYSLATIANMIDDQWLFKHETYNSENLQYIGHQSNNLVDLYLDLAKQEDVKGLLILNEEYLYSPGYYHFHHQVPFYDIHLFENIPKELIRYEQLFSHIISAQELHLSPDYVQVSPRGKYEYITSAAKKNIEVFEWDSYVIHAISSGIHKIALQLIRDAKIPPTTVDWEAIQKTAVQAQDKT